MVIQRVTLKGQKHPFALGPTLEMPVESDKRKEGTGERSGMEGWGLKITWSQTSLVMKGMNLGLETHKCMKNVNHITGLNRL